MSEVSEMAGQSFFGGLRNSFKSVATGFAFFIAAFPTLFLNEGCSVQTQKSLEEGQGAVVSVSAEKAEAANDKKLVHLTGRATTDAVLKDEEFGIEVTALKLHRKSLIYQWEESERTEEDEDGTKRKIYDYEKTWSDKLIDSGKFKGKKANSFRNIGTLDFPSREQIAEPITVGAFHLSAGLIRQIRDEQPVPPTDEITTLLNTDDEDRWSIHEGTLYRSETPNEPQIGDLMVEFTTVEPADVSIIAMQMGDKLAAYQTKAGDALERLQVGTHSSESMFEAAMAENTSRTWMIRGFGFAMMVAGLGGMLMPFRHIASVVPLLGGILQAGVRLFCLLIGGGLSLITIGIAWIFYRPLLGILLLLLGAAGFAAVWYLAKKNSPVPTTDPPMQAVDSPMPDVDSPIPADDGVQDDEDDIV